MRNFYGEICWCKKFLMRKYDEKALEDPYRKFVEANLKGLIFNLHFIAIS